jgi:hypothetical protein
LSGLFPKRASLVLKFSICFASLGVAIILAEWLLRKIDPQPFDPWLEQQLAAAGPIAIKEGDDIHPRIVEPIFHHSTSPLLVEQGSMEDHSFVIRTNHQGFRGIKDFNYEKSPNVFRIAVLGDSFTFGQFVSDEETFPSQLETQLKTKFPQTKWEVLNFGVISYSPILYFRLYDRLVRNYKPDLVIVALDNSDLQDDYVYEKDAVLDSQGNIQNFVDKSFGFESVERFTQISSQLDSFSGRTLGWLRSHSQIALRVFGSSYTKKSELGNIAVDRLGHFRVGADWTIHWQRSKKYLSKLSDAIQQDHASFILLYYPYPHQVNGEAWKSRIYQGFKMGLVYETPLEKWLNDFASEKKMPFIDTVAAFRRSKINFCFDTDFHYRPEGYQILAEELIKPVLAEANTTLRP